MSSGFESGQKAFMADKMDFFKSFLCPTSPTLRCGSWQASSTYALLCNPFYSVLDVVFRKAMNL
ncbi:AVN_HP_G0120090.mRNA.1.CDS.1 [Saccharomyces cerevisiae]|nr:AVN_HP_G0120090.mRNA.1.CDS.1 [Saccharomyces cerevisiae]CAI6997178.1 AVN_HP_G0120090.mRNA.1.CDS.1 [Saccharomyces cerevisiae]